MSSEALEPYNSFEETSTKCLLCLDEVDDPILLGPKLRAGDVTAHYYCVLLSPPLAQCENDDNGLMGFNGDKIKKEVKRSVKLVRVPLFWSI